VESIISENCHPALLNMFTVLQNGNVSTDQQARIGIGKRCFSVFAPGKYNCSMNPQAVEDAPNINRNFVTVSLLEDLQRQLDSNRHRMRQIRQQ